jgi:formylglycine-generating enzyme required for sulfatase activity
VQGEGRQARLLELPDFAISRAPVTFEAWGEFLQALEREQGLDAVKPYVPMTAGDGAYMARTEDGRWTATPNVCEGPARDRCLREHGPGFDGRLPVAGVSWHDAMAYCAWKTRMLGHACRLPTEQEREKAARGVDGRRFPWGDLEDASLAKCRASREEPAQPEPVGAFPTATSVYGMLDASGNTWEWTDSWHESGQFTRIVKGGGCYDQAGVLRASNRGAFGPEFRHVNLGFRVVRALRA